MRYVNRNARVAEELSHVLTKNYWGPRRSCAGNLPHMKRRRTSHNAHRRVDVDCVDCLEARRCWGQPLTERSDVIVRRQASLAKGGFLLRQGEPFNAVYIVVRGCLSLRETMSDGGERIVGFRVPGELVGIEGWARDHYTYTATAAETVMACRLAWPCASVKSVGSNVLLQRLLAKTAAQLDQSSQLWPGLPALERVAAFVDDFTRRARALGFSGERITLPMTRAELGSYLGLAEETVVRAMTQLRLQRRLDIKGRSVSVRPSPTSP